jgi:putative transposase
MLQLVQLLGYNGTVKARKFINPARDIDRRNKRRTDDC